MNWKRIICKIEGKHRPEILFFMDTLRRREAITRCGRCKKVLSKTNNFEPGISVTFYMNASGVEPFPKNYLPKTGDFIIKAFNKEYLQQKYNEAFRAEEYEWAADILQSAKSKGIQLTTNV